MVRGRGTRPKAVAAVAAAAEARAAGVAAVGRKQVGAETGAEKDGKGHWKKDVKVGAEAADAAVGVAVDVVEEGNSRSTLR